MSKILFNDFTEIKPYISANANNEIATLEPYINDAVRDYIIPIIGNTEWQSILTAFPDNLSTEQQNILPLLQNAIANFAYYLFADDGTLNITDFGINRTEDEQSKSAYQWQVRAFKDRRWINGWNALENLAQYLYANIDDYDSWAISDERTNYNELFVWNTLQFRQFYRINSLGTLFTLHPQIKEIQLNVLKSAITATLYNAVLADIMDGTLSDANADLLPYLQRVVVFGALMQVSTNFGYEFGKQGLQITTVEGTSQNSDKTANAVNQARQNLLAEFTTKYNNALTSLIQFLKTNASSSLYTSYYNAFVNITAAEVVDNNLDKGLKFFG